jgi:hypothetical protein
MNSQTASVREGEFEDRVILMDKDNRPSAIVLGTFLPKIRSVGIRLSASSAVELILTTTFMLQRTDGSLYRLTNGERCSAFHFDSPEQPHLTFDHEPLS